MWEMCQSPAESCDWLTGHTPPPSSSSHCLQTWTAQTLRRGLHSNCHFRRVASCKYPLFPLSSSALCSGLCASIPLFPPFFLVVCLFLLFPTWPASLYFGLFLFLFRANTYLEDIKDKKHQPEMSYDWGFFKGKIHLAVFLLAIPHLIVPTWSSFFVFTPNKHLFCHENDCLEPFSKFTSLHLNSTAHFWLPTDIHTH